ncbi:MAG: T9SS type A sorting domain-containing protein [Candidatus Symbiothrix sp.]|jgi:hypothetical protein|nr:T9SS type A sorting domain-containing protein [Candidatus Symbiothrix sp.]
MKRIIFTSFFLMSLFFGLQAQSLASFEDDAENNLRVANFDTDGDPGWYESASYVEGGQPQIGANPSKSGINTSDKCVLAVNVANADWWGNFFSLMLDQPITITESNKYLHLMVYRSIQPKNFCIGFNDRNEDAGRVFQGKLKEDGVWENVVVDLSSKIDQELSYLGFICSANWDDPREGWDVATYAFDNFALSNSPLPPNVTLVDGNGLKIGYESQSEIEQWVNEIDLQNANNTSAIIDNPFTESAVNAGGKVLQFNKSSEASWWQGYRIDFNGIMEVGGTYPQYIHTLVYIPADVITGEMTGVDIQLCAKDHLGNENTELFTVWDDEVGEWIDLVMEVNQIVYLKELTVRYDLRKEGDEYVNSPANIFYLDEIEFNKDADPRTLIESGISPAAVEGLANVISAANAIQIIANQDVAIRVYTVAGSLIHSANVTGKTVLPIEKGLYLVKINATKGNQVVKVLVQ